MSSRQILTADEIRRALVRIGHEIVEKHGGTERLALVGIERRGVPLAGRIAEAIAATTGVRLPVGSLDITFYRDDLTRVDRGPQLRGQDLPFDPAQATIVLVDDVLYTGRTVRAAMDALVDQGRPAAVRLAVLVDRGHRELPIRADHVGKNVPTSRDEVVHVRVAEVDGGLDEVVIERHDPPDALTPGTSSSTAAAGVGAGARDAGSAAGGSATGGGSAAGGGASA